MWRYFKKFGEIKKNFRIIFGKIIGEIEKTYKEIVKNFERY